MSTKIFSVQFEVNERYDGKTSETIQDSKRVVAKDGEDAIAKVKSSACKPFSYVSDETDKRVKVTRTGFKVRGVTLLAETD